MQTNTIAVMGLGIAPSVLHVLSDIAFSLGGTAIVLSVALPYIIWGEAIIDLLVHKLDQAIQNVLDAVDGSRLRRARAEQVAEALRRMDEQYRLSHGAAQE